MAKWVNLDDCVEISVGEMNFYPVELLGDIYEEVAPVIHAHWICKSVDDNDNGEYTCSRCGCGEEHSITCEVPYCWRCGAKMDGVIYNE